MSKCIFCEIVESNMPAYVVYEDEFFKVIMDKFPASRGHLLIVPKCHSENIFDLPFTDARNIYPLAQKMAKGLREILGAEGINIVQNNGAVASQAVFHFHLHVIPRYGGDGVRINQPTTFVTNETEIAELAKILKENL